MSSSFCLLPSELVWNIISLLNPADLSNTRLVSKKLRNYCDHPVNWRHILLDPSTISATTGSNNNNISCDNILTLWNLPDLKATLQPHLQLIQSIQIWGVRDNIVRFLILHCHKLQDLTILGWSTLSDHALRIPLQPEQKLCLRRLRLVGRPKSNFTSLDASTFGKLIAQCPHLEELSVVSCQIHMEADSLLESFNHPTSRQDDQFISGDTNTTGDSTSSSLKSLTVATKRTWSIQHVTRLFQLCPNLRFLALVPDSRNLVIKNISNSSTTLFETNITMHTQVLKNYQPLLKKNVHMIEEREMLEFDNIVIYSL